MYVRLVLWLPKDTVNETSRPDSGAAASKPRLGVTLQ